MNRLLKITGVITVIAGLVAFLYWSLGQKTLSNVANNFIDAVKNKNWDEVAKFIHPIEKEKLALNSEKIRYIGENLILPLWNRLGITTVLKEIENPFMPETQEEKLFFKDTHFFQVFRNGDDGEVVLVTKTNEGWRVNFSFFVHTLLVEANSQGFLSHEQVRSILRKVGISQIFIGKESAPLLP